MFVHQWDIRIKDLHITYWVRLGHWSVGIQDALRIQSHSHICAQLPSEQHTLIPPGCSYRLQYLCSGNGVLESGDSDRLDTDILPTGDSWPFLRECLIFSHIKIPSYG
jgi:hypothetical protein